MAGSSAAPEPVSQAVTQSRVEPSIEVGLEVGDLLVEERFGGLHLCDAVVSHLEATRGAHELLSESKNFGPEHVEVLAVDHVGVRWGVRLGHGPDDTAVVAGAGRVRCTRDRRFFVRSTGPTVSR